MLDVPAAAFTTKKTLQSLKKKSQNSFLQDIIYLNVSPIDHRKNEAFKNIFPKADFATKHSVTSILFRSSLQWLLLKH